MGQRRAVMSCEQRARAADVDDTDAAVGLVAEQLLHPLGHLADRVDRGADEEVLLGAEPAEGEAEEQRTPHLVLRLVRTAAVEGLAEVVDRRPRLHLRRHDLVLLRLALAGQRWLPGTTRVAPFSAVKSHSAVEDDDLELRHVRSGAASRSVGIGGWIQAVSSRWRCWTVSSGRISISWAVLSR